MTEPTDTPDPLSPTHRHMLEVDSGISTTVIAARGYQTIKVKARLAELGFSQSQWRVPTLLIPVHGLSGEIATYQSRPDHPRISKGKPLKYETPTGTRMVLDVPPSLQEQPARSSSTRPAPFSPATPPSRPLVRSACPGSG